VSAEVQGHPSGPPVICCRSMLSDAGCAEARAATAHVKLLCFYHPFSSRGERTFKRGNAERRQKSECTMSLNSLLKSRSTCFAHAGSYIPLGDDTGNRR
jgi:hypothetical protein